MSLALSAAQPGKLNLYKWLAPLFVLGGMLFLHWFPDPQFALFAGFGLFVLPFFFSNRSSLLFFTFLSFYFTQTSVPIFYQVFGQARWILLGLCLIIAFLENMQVRNLPVHKIGKEAAWRWLFILIAAGSLAYSIDKGTTIEYTISLAAIFLAIPLLIKPYISTHGADKFIKVTLFAILPLYLLSMLYIRSGSSYIGNNSASSFQELERSRVFNEAYSLGGERGFSRFRGIFQNPNTVGVITALLFPLVLYKCFQEKDKRIYLIFAGIMILSLILSDSREGLGACFLSGVLVSFRYYGFHKLMKRFIVKLWPILSLTAILLFYLYETGFLEHYLRLKKFVLLGGRLEAWIAATQLISAKPWSGYGFGTEKLLFHRAGYIFMFHEGAYAHNSYLGLAMQLGILSPLLLFIPLLYMFLTELAARNPSGARIALHGVLLSGLLLCLTESWIYSAGNSQALPFWACIGALEYLRFKENKASQKPQAANQGLVAPA